MAGARRCHLKALRDGAGSATVPQRRANAMEQFPARQMASAEEGAFEASEEVRGSQKASGSTSVTCTRPSPGRQSDEVLATNDAGPVTRSFRAPRESRRTLYCLFSNGAVGDQQMQDFLLSRQDGLVTRSLNASYSPDVQCGQPPINGHRKRAAGYGSPDRRSGGSSFVLSFRILHSLREFKSLPAGSKKPGGSLAMPRRR
jgi:hypothetical protein